MTAKKKHFYACLKVVDLAETNKANLKNFNFVMVVKKTNLYACLKVVDLVGTIKANLKKIELKFGGSAGTKLFKMHCKQFWKKVLKI